MTVPAELDPARWDVYCGTDPTRNHLIVPYIRQKILSLRPSSIADVGCGTGYIAAKLLETWPAPWRLIDRSLAMLAFARTILGERCSFHQLDLAAENPAFPKSDLVLAVNTLLETGCSAGIAASLLSLVSPGGTLFIWLPDVWEDVLNKEDSAILASFMRGDCEIPKSRWYFRATRPETLIGTFLRQGALLQNLELIEEQRHGGMRRHIAMTLLRNRVGR